jgi:hypothetical protein
MISIINQIQARITGEAKIT